MKIRQEEVAALLKADSNARYKNFMKRVVNFEHAWGLWSDGWALLGDKDGECSIPLWPADVYARLYASGDWEHFEVQRIELDRLVDQFLSDLSREAVSVAVFPVAGSRSIVVPAGELAQSLRAEMSNYSSQ